MLLLIALIGPILRFGWLSRGRGDIVEAARPLMDTVVRIKVYGRDRDLAQRLIEQAFGEMGRLEWEMGRQKEGALHRLNQEAGGPMVSIPQDLNTVLERSMFFSRLSHGAFDVSIAPVKDLWGFDTEHPHLPSEAEIRSRLPLVDFRAIEIQDGKVRLPKSGMALDLGGVAKGYIVDRAMDILRAGKVLGALVEAGGDLRFFGTKPGGKSWRIALQHPRQPERLIYLDDIGLHSVATSGDYERYFTVNGRRYHHILDPKTGYPADRCVSATVWTTTAMDADALSTALFVMGPEEGLSLIEELADTEGFVMYEQEGMLRSRGSSGVQGKVHMDE